MISILAALSLFHLAEKKIQLSNCLHLRFISFSSVFDILVMTLSFYLY